MQFQLNLNTAHVKSLIAESSVPTAPFCIFILQQGFNSVPELVTLLYCKSFAVKSAKDLLGVHNDVVTSNDVVRRATGKCSYHFRYYCTVKLTQVTVQNNIIATAF